MDGADDCSIQSILEFNLQGRFHLLLVMRGSTAETFSFYSSLQYSVCSQDSKRTDH